MNASEVKKSQGRGKGFVNSQKPNRYCTFCHKTNHTVDFCYQLHGHPSFPKQQPKVNVATHEIPDEIGALDHGLGGSTGSGTSLSPEQYTQLVSLLQQASLISSSSLPSTSNATTNHVQITPFVSNNISASPHDTAGISSKRNYWLLDLGANEHICPNFSFFTSLHRIKPVRVILPNNTSIIVRFAGNVVFTPQFYLTNVLYSPLCQMNLLSVAKLYESLSYVLHFSHGKFLIQDQTSLKMIGLAKQVAGLYRYTPPSDFCSTSFMHSPNKSCNFSSSISCNSNNCITVAALWHFRLGHLSNQRMTKMSHLYPSIVHNNKDVCDICNFSKQKHLPFSSSLSHASTNFELLHFDIWGPISISSVHGHRYFLTILDDHS